MGTARRSKDNRTLVEQGVVAKEQYEQLRAEYDSLLANSEAARAVVRSADETIKVDNAAIETAKVQLSYCFIYSPIDAAAGQRLVDIGNVVPSRLRQFGCQTTTPC
jgi:multidrug resistance efflux pump